MKHKSDFLTVDLPVKPDAEWLACEVLRDALHARIHVGVTYPGQTPAIVISRVGGVADTHGLIDRPRIDVDVYAATKEEAHDLAQAARAVVFAASGSSRSGAVIGGVQEFLGLTFVPDADTEGTPRYTFTYEWTVH